MQFLASNDKKKIMKKIGNLNIELLYKLIIHQRLFSQIQWYFF